MKGAPGADRRLVRMAGVAHRLRPKLHAGFNLNAQNSLMDRTFLNS